MWWVLIVIVALWCVGCIGDCVQKELEQRKQVNIVIENNNMNEENYRNVEIGSDKINLNF